MTEENAAPLDVLPKGVIDAARWMTLSVAAVCAKQFFPDTDQILEVGKQVCSIFDRVTINGDLKVLPAFFGDVDRLPSLAQVESIKQKDDYPQQVGLLAARAGLNTALAIYQTMPAGVPVEVIQRYVLHDSAVMAGMGWGRLGGADTEATGHISALANKYMEEAVFSGSPKRSIDKVRDNIRASIKSGQWPPELAEIKDSSPFFNVIVNSVLVALVSTSWALLKIEETAPSTIASSDEINAWTGVDRPARTERRRPLHLHRRHGS